MAQWSTSRRHCCRHPLQGFVLLLLFLLTIVSSLDVSSSTTQKRELEKMKKIVEWD
jgi:hypothetical protein